MIAARAVPRSANDATSTGYAAGSVDSATDFETLGSAADRDGTDGPQSLEGAASPENSDGHDGTSDCFGP